MEQVPQIPSHGRQIFVFIMHISCTNSILADDSKAHGYCRGTVCTSVRLFVRLSLNDANAFQSAIYHVLDMHYSDMLVKL